MSIGFSCVIGPAHRNPYTTQEVGGLGFSGHGSPLLVILNDWQLVQDVAADNAYEHNKGADDKIEVCARLETFWGLRKGRLCYDSQDAN